MRRAINFNLVTRRKFEKRKNTNILFKSFLLLFCFVLFLLYSFSRSQSSTANKYSFYFLEFGDTQTIDIPMYLYILANTDSAWRLGGVLGVGGMLPSSSSLTPEVVAVVDSDYLSVMPGMKATVRE